MGYATIDFLILEGVRFITRQDLISDNLVEAVYEF